MSKLFQNKYRISSARLKDYDYSQPGAYFITICMKNRKCYFGEVVGDKMVLSKIGKIVKEELLKTPQIRRNVLLDEWVIMPNHVHVIFEIIDNNVVETQCIASIASCGNLEIPKDDRVVETQAVETQAVETQVVETQSVETRAVETQAVETQSVETQSVETRAVETQAVETQAVETQSVETQSVETQVVETQVVETQVVETQVVETQCVETQAVETQCIASLQSKQFKNKFGPQKNNLPSIVRGFKSAVTTSVKKKYGKCGFAWQERYYDVIIEDEENYNRIVKYILDNPGKWAEDKNNPINLKNEK